MRVPAALRLIVSLALLGGVTLVVAVWILDRAGDDAPAAPATVVQVRTASEPVPLPAQPAPTVPVTPAATVPPTAGPTPTGPVQTLPTPAAPDPVPATPPVAGAPAPVGPAPAPVARPVGSACFGAAALDPLRPCHSTRLAGTVYPTPATARAAQKVEGCRRSFDRDLLRICFWGASAREATRTIAIIGDSHASHWRAAMQPVVAAKRWRVISMSRAACPLTLARPDLPGTERKVGCLKWNREVQAYLEHHPSISAVFTGAHRGAVIPLPGESMRAAQRAGYAKAWLKLLAGGVRHIVVFRDTPRINGATLRCIVAAQAERTAPGTACALPRSYALRPDPMVEAAARLPGKVQVADLSQFFCDEAVCWPVIGGALVLRDVSHMTTTYSASLGPYLERAVNRLTRGWRDARRPGL
jgi:hypothetical protein